MTELLIPDSWESWIAGAMGLIAVAAFLGAFLFFTIRNRKQEEDLAAWHRKQEAEAAERAARRYTYEQFISDLEDPAVSIDEICAKCIAVGHVPKKLPPPPPSPLDPIGPGASAGGIGAHAGLGSLFGFFAGLAAGPLMATPFSDRR